MGRGPRVNCRCLVQAVVCLLNWPERGGARQSERINRPRSHLYNRGGVVSINSKMPQGATFSGGACTTALSTSVPLTLPRTGLTDSSCSRWLWVCMPIHTRLKAHPLGRCRQTMHNPTQWIFTLTPTSHPRRHACTLLPWKVPSSEKEWSLG